MKVVCIVHTSQIFAHKARHKSFGILPKVLSFLFMETVANSCHCTSVSAKKLLFYRIPGSFMNIRYHRFVLVSMFYVQILILYLVFKAKLYWPLAGSALTGNFF